MAKYRTTDAAAGQGLFLTVNLKEQLLPGTFEYMLDKLIGTKVDISYYDRNYHNDQTGASAVPPAVLLKLIIYSYSKGCMSSRKISELNSNNIVAKALTGDMEIHFTTVADFIAMNGTAFEETFVEVLTYCNELGLIGGETFAVDGLRLPSNASIEMSGTEEQLRERLTLYRKMAEKHMKRHQKRDAAEAHGEEEQVHYEERQKYLNRQIEKISSFLEGMEKKIGRGGDEIKSNVTDNESAMIQSSKGYLQGYIGMATSDEKNQIITSAQAVGTANEGEHLPEMLDKNRENMKAAGVKELEEGQRQRVLGDANYFSEENLKACQERGIEAIIPDGQEKRRLNSEGEKRFDLEDFKYHEGEDYYECPKGKRLIYKGITVHSGVEGKVYQACLSDCKACPFFSKCSWSKREQSKLNQGKVLRITEKYGQGNLIRRMRKKQDTEEFKALYALRIQIVEPVFANIRYCKGLNRFTLRGKEKVNGQWLLYCMVHNLGKCMNELNIRRNTP